MPSSNIKMLQIVADGLEELKEEVVFVGGAVAELYADDPASSEIRPTLDVDVKMYLKSECQKLLENDALSEAINCALPLGSDSDRVEMIEAQITEISELT